ncbi:MAG: sigma-70 family RNA polymerase sigma factor [Roseburia sp.]|nr:sigma-70 family RNA polymerase sigma factor [Anaeroplasma bactoclasticum]MCM1195451.1 sigma-70 family RNA polymerase sigma factor [Roseburia sp.]MCM1555930.1 sigma-70 family RNA polymerase sigma factor [Anaeroplasma bactoclasticum]
MGNLNRIIEKLRKKDYSEFDLFYEQTKKTIYFTIKNIVLDEEITKDLMQDTYVKFLNHLDSYKNDNLNAYLALMARNIAINEYNKRKREMISEEFIEGLKAEPTSLNQNVFRILEILSADEREIVIYHIVENLKFKDIARIVGKSLGTVLWIYNKAIKKLQERKDEYYGEKKY